LCRPGPAPIIGGVPDLRPLFTDRTAEATRPGLRMVAVPSPPRLRLDADTVRLLRAGLGRYDMEMRWLAHLDDAGVLRVWRSWTGHQIYEVTVAPDGSLAGLTVEEDPDRHRGTAAAEPAQFEAVLTTVVNELRGLRAGHTPYGPVPGADPAPPRWPR
jgi:hypothetical protein